MAIENIRISQRGKEQLITIKRRTKIQNWNIICRWAFSISLAEKTKPSIIKIVSDSNIEMTWKIFAGKQHEIYWALLKQRCKDDGYELSDSVLSEQFKLHLHRGIQYLASDRSLTGVDGLLQLK